MTALLRRWRARIGGRHPSEDRLLEVVFGAGDTGATLSTARHLRNCARCAQRAGDLRTFVETLADDAGASFDEAFPPDRLQAQRARIAHRLARTGGRVGAHAARGRPRRLHPMICNASPRPHPARRSAP